MLYIDEKFARYTSVHLRNFKRIREYTYNFSCPICGDSQKSKIKARGYLYPNESRTGMIYKCHNCAVSMSFSNFLKECFSSLYDEYVMEKYGSDKKAASKDLEEVVFDTPAFQKELQFAVPINELPNDHFALKYILDRKIPEDKHGIIYYTDNFSKVVEAVFPGEYKDLPENDHRIVLPFYNRSSEIIGLQGRSLMKTKLRYITARANKNVTLVYGLERCIKNERTYVVEGPFDSLFLHNSIAVASSDLCSIINRISGLNDFVLVFDNEPRNKEIVKLIGEAIKSGMNVCIWPDTIVEKDINDMVLAGRNAGEVQEIINTNVLSGIEAQLAYDSWRKC